MNQVDWMRRRKLRRVVLLAGACMLLPWAWAGADESATWTARLAPVVEKIDAQMPGTLGVYVGRPGGEGAYRRHANRRWYLSSTVKVPVAIAVLEQVDAGRLSLDEQLLLRESDFVDGAGDMLFQKPGTRHTIAKLLQKSLQDSDSTATDMLIRHLGEDHINSRVREWTGGGFGRITTILQVRYDVYGALHPEVEHLDNRQIVSLRQAEAGEPRLQALAKLLGVARGDLGRGSFEDAFEAYYRKGDNSATLEAFAKLLDRLVGGELLSAGSTARLLDHMRRITTGDRRIQAGLPEGTDFIQKTGTQVRRACNVGVLEPQRGREGAVVIVACAEKFGALAQAEKAFSDLGRALAAAGVIPPAAGDAARTGRSPPQSPR